MAAKGLTGILAALLAARASVAANSDCCPCKEKGLCLPASSQNCQRALRLHTGDKCKDKEGNDRASVIDGKTFYLCDVVLHVDTQHLSEDCDLKFFAGGQSPETLKLVKENMATGLTPTLSQDSRSWVYDGVYKKLERALWKYTPKSEFTVTDVLTKILTELEGKNDTNKQQLEGNGKADETEAMTDLKTALEKSKAELREVQRQIRTEQEKRLEMKANFNKAAVEALQGMREEIKYISPKLSLQGEANQKAAVNALKVMAAEVDKITMNLSKEAGFSKAGEEAAVRKLQEMAPKFKQAVKDFEANPAKPSQMDIFLNWDLKPTVEKVLEEFNEQARRSTRWTTRARSHKLFRRPFKRILTKWTV